MMRAWTLLILAIISKVCGTSNHEICQRISARCQAFNYVRPGWPIILPAITGS